MRCFVEFDLNFVAKTWVHPLCQKREEENRDGLKVVTIEIIEIVTTIIVTTFKCCNNLRKVVTI